MLVEVLRIMLLDSLRDCLDEFENAIEQPQSKAGGTILNPVFLAEVPTGMEIQTSLCCTKGTFEAIVYSGIGRPLKVFALHKRWRMRGHSWYREAGEKEV